MGIRNRWVGVELFGVHWQRKQNQSIVRKDNTYREKKNNIGE